MDEKKQRKIIWGVIGVLCLVAVGLSVWIGIVVSRTTGEGADNLAWSDAQLLYLNFHANFNKVEEEVGALLLNEPIDIEKIKNIYLEKINEAASLGDYGIAAAYRISAIDKLSEAGLERKALDMLLSMDVESYPDIERYYHYESIIDLARRLGDEDIITKYEPMLLELKDVYEQSILPEEA